jgi:Uri superfamily endonuclease
MAAGYYLYVGSAFGPGGLAARLTHHQSTRSPRKRPHWHIDYLRPYTHLCEIWTLAGAPRMETTWCLALMNIPGLVAPVPGFGASDSTLPAHLFYMPVYPSCRLLTHTLLTPIISSSTDIPHLTIDIQRVPEVDL